MEIRGNQGGNMNPLGESPQEKEDYQDAVNAYNKGDYPQAAQYLLAACGGSPGMNSPAENWIATAEQDKDPGGPPPCPWKG